MAKEAVDGVFAAIGDALVNGEEVQIAGFGTFGTGSGPARTGRNPRTGEAVSMCGLTHFMEQNVMISPNGRLWPIALVSP